MARDLAARGLSSCGVPHGFGPQDCEVADGFHLVRVKQVHEATVLIADANTASTAGDADGLMTETPGVAVAIATADCVPVLMADTEGRVVASVHAGWRGSLAGIVTTAVRLFRERFGIDSTSLRVALGPSISGCCYEVERDIAQQFADRHGEPAWAAWQDGAPGKGYLDLRRMNTILLEKSGVPRSHIDHTGPCTFCGTGPFASYRRNGAKAARQLSWITPKSRG